MKINFKSLLVCTAFSSLLFSCQKETGVQTTQNNIPSNVLDQIRAHGFSTDGVIQQSDGYVVKGDVFVSFKDLAKSPLNVSLIRLA